MPSFEVTVEFTSSIRPFKSIDQGKIRITPSGTGFVLVKTIEPHEVDLSVGPQGAPTREFQQALSVLYGAKSWSQTLAECLTLITGVPAQFMVKSAVPLPEPPSEGRFNLISSGVAHLEQKAEPVNFLLTVELLNEALRIQARLTSDKSMELFHRAMGWYARGVADSDLVDKFIDHWIALETLSNTTDKPVEPRACDHCRKIIDPRPDGAVVRAFLKQHGFESEMKTIMNCRNIRGRLFHEATALREAESMQPLLTNVLRNCLMKQLPS